jgi:hypothetical protein
MRVARGGIEPQILLQRVRTLILQSDGSRERKNVEKWRESETGEGN